jgi:Cu(I)/Ag(I) efflux system membrane protein CusA/SilA
MDSFIRVPGWGNIWTQPIINRIDMLATGVRTMISVKVFGKDPTEIRESPNVATVLRGFRRGRRLPDPARARRTSRCRSTVRAPRRYGVNVGDVQDVVGRGRRQGVTQTVRDASVIRCASASRATRASTGVAAADARRRAGVVSGGSAAPPPDGRVRGRRLRRARAAAARRPRPARPSRRHVRSTLQIPLSRSPTSRRQSRR